MNPRRLCPFLALAALLPLGGCAALTREPRLPRTTAAVETRRDLLAVGLRPGTIEGPRGALPAAEVPGSSSARRVLPWGSSRFQFPALPG